MIGNSKTNYARTSTQKRRYKASTVDVVLPKIKEERY